jgi:hypothetical protein
MMLPSVRWDRVGTRKLHAYFGDQYWAYTSPVNASQTALLSFMHDSEPGWLAWPSLLGTCTPSIVPVLIGAPQRLGAEPHCAPAPTLQTPKLVRILKRKKRPILHARSAVGYNPRLCEKRAPGHDNQRLDVVVWSGSHYVY